jgi:hypothetical protein
MKNINVKPNFQGFISKLIIKKPVLLIVLAFLSMGVWATPPLVSKQQIGMFKNSITCVVLEGESISYNLFIKEAVEKYWKATTFEFIDHQEFEKRRTDSKYSFIVLLKEVWDKDPGGVSYDYLSLLMGGTAKELNQMPELITLPISYTDNKNMDYGFVIPTMVKFMQKHAKNLETKRFMISMNGLKYYNTSRVFKDKVLILNKEDMAPSVDNTEKIKAVYPYYFKFMTVAELENELLTDPSNTLFLFHVGPGENSGAGKCFEMVFDVYGNLFYYSYRDVTNEDKDGFTTGNFRNLR